MISGPYKVIRGLNYILLQVVIKHSVQVHMQSHKLSERLLPKEPLRLQVHLGYSLGGQTSAPIV
jgi:hypothetical protein